ncbi:MAG: hypothetical protein A2103_03775 [Gammaproteobacteria bacterium GWF2_41_13]|nr:MAG: hypothetical protein A2103_03775 [Gammaproteobacteria bacterium GWF2_41_13]
MNRKKYVYAILLFFVISAMWWYKQYSAKSKATKTAICLQLSSINYLNAWAIACAQQAKNIEMNLASCANLAEAQENYDKTIMQKPQAHALYLIAIAQCKSIYGTPDSSPTCGLLGLVADNLTGAFNAANALCLKHDA